MRVEDAPGRSAVGWGETPLSVQWAWPSTLPYGRATARCGTLPSSSRGRGRGSSSAAHPIEVGHRFLEGELPGLLAGFNAEPGGRPAMPWLAALVCSPPFDLALHDAYGVLHGVPIYQTYDARCMTRDLSAYLEPADGSGAAFHGLYPQDFLVAAGPQPGRPGTSSAASTRSTRTT